MRRRSAPPLAALDFDAWERSIDVNLKGFLYCVAAALPVVREGGGGRVIVLDVLDPSSPDPLLEAGRAAVRVLLRELADELGEEGMRSDLVRADRSVVDPARCAEAVRGLLLDQTPGPAGYSVHEVPRM